MASGAEAGAMLRRDQGHLRADLELLDGPGVAVRIGKSEERAAVALVEDLDLAALDAAAHQLVPGGQGIRDHQLEPPDRPGRHFPLRGQVPDHDRAAGAGRRQLRDVHPFVGRVVVEVEADLVAVERDRVVDVADGEDDDFEGPVHARMMPERQSTSRRVRSVTSHVSPKSVEPAKPPKRTIWWRVASKATACPFRGSGAGPVVEVHSFPEPVHSHVANAPCAAPPSTSPGWRGPSPNVCLGLKAGPPPPTGS